MMYGLAVVQEATERVDPRVKKRDELVIPTHCGKQLYIVMCVCKVTASKR